MKGDEEYSFEDCNLTMCILFAPADRGGEIYPCSPPDMICGDGVYQVDIDTMYYYGVLWANCGVCVYKSRQDQKIVSLVLNANAWYLMRHGFDCTRSGLVIVQMHPAPGLYNHFSFPLVKREK